MDHRAKAEAEFINGFPEEEVPVTTPCLRTGPCFLNDLLRFQDGVAIEAGVKELSVPRISSVKDPRRDWLALQQAPTQMPRVRGKKGERYRAGGRTWFASRTRVSLTEAVRQFAEAHTLLNGNATLAEAVKCFLAERKKAQLPSIKFPDLVKLFLENIEEEKKSRRYRLDMQARLNKAKETFSGNVADIHATDINAWLKEMKHTSGRTKNNYRSALATLLSYAREEGYLPRGIQTEAGRHSIHPALPLKVTSNGRPYPWRQLAYRKPSSRSGPATRFCSRRNRFQKHTFEQKR